MPNRILKESICASEQIELMTAEEEVFFYRLIVVCDDFGLMDARLPILKARCYPLKSIDINRIQVFLNHLSNYGLAKLYSVDGKPFIQLLGWDKHQQRRASKAKYPMPEQADSSTCNQLISNVPVFENVFENENENVIGNDKSNSIELLVPSQSARDSKPDACPHQEIITLYHELLPVLPAVKVWNNGRAGLLRQRWREDSKRRDLDWWKRYFRYVAESDFLTGKTTPQVGKPPFVADLEWLLKPGNLAKVIEGKYHQEAA